MKNLKVIAGIFLIVARVMVFKISGNRRNKAVDDKDVYRIDISLENSGDVYDFMYIYVLGDREYDGAEIVNRHGEAFSKDDMLYIPLSRKDFNNSEDIKGFRIQFALFNADKDKYETNWLEIPDENYGRKSKVKITGSFEEGFEAQTVN